MKDLTEYLNHYDMMKGDLDELQNRLDAEWRSGDPQRHQESMINFMDRIGDEPELHGVEWSVLHGLESLEGHNEAVVRNWKPTYWRKILIKRIANAGITHIAGHDIQEYIES